VTASAIHFACNGIYTSRKKAEILDEQHYMVKAVCDGICYPPRLKQNKQRERLDYRN
jgi:hypothetical protein